MRMARLHASLAVMAVVEDNDGEVRRLLDADGGERAHPHQHLAVAGDDENAFVRLRQSETKANHRRAAHGAPQIEVAIIVASGGEIPAGRAEARNDEQIVLAVREQGRHGGTTFQTCGARRVAHLVQTFLPMSCCDNNNAAMRSSPNTCCTARSASPSTSSGLVAR